MGIKRGEAPVFRTPLFLLLFILRLGLLATRISFSIHQSILQYFSSFRTLPKHQNGPLVSTRRPRRD